MKTAIVYGAKWKEAAAAADWLEKNGYRVTRRNREDLEEDWGQEADLLVLQPDTDYAGNDGPVGTAHDYDEMAEIVGKRLFETETVLEKCLPLLRKGEQKRIAFLTKKSSSVRECEDQDRFVEHAILAGTNMQAKLYYNQLRKEGFTMRCFAADKEDSAEKGISAGAYVSMDLCYDAEDAYIHSEENRFVMRDSFFKEIPW